jgi:hypothetical protein
MSGCEKGKISIRTALQQRDAALYHRLETIWIAIAREIQERRQSKEGYQQGPLHCGMVEERQSITLTIIRNALLPKLISGLIRISVKVRV